MIGRTPVTHLWRTHLTSWGGLQHAVHVACLCLHLNVLLAFYHNLPHRQEHSPCIILLRQTTIS